MNADKKLKGNPYLRRQAPLACSRRRSASIGGSDSSFPFH
jgi:hypothetical protein